MSSVFIASELYSEPSNRPEARGKRAKRPICKSAASYGVFTLKKIKRGTAYLKAGDINAGIEDLNRRPDLTLKAPLHTYNQGFAYSKVGGIEKARFCFKEAYSPGLKEARFQLKLLGLNDVMLIR